MDSLITHIITIKGHYILQVVIEKTATNQGGLSHHLLKKKQNKKKVIEQDWIRRK